jgi:DNA excision repair protein ERCC-4
MAASVGSPPRLRAELHPQDVTAIVDTREQCPLDLSPLSMQPGTLTTGDYSVRGLEHVVAVERKSLPDLIACCGVERERFEREIQRMLAFPVRCVVVEAGWLDLESGSWRSKILPDAVVGSVLGWIAMGVPFVMVVSRERAQRYTGRLLLTTARRRWRELRSFGDVILAGCETILPHNGF